MVCNSSDVDDFCAYVKTIIEKETVLLAGFDSEWKPVKPNGASLLQIAFFNDIFLVDLMALKQHNCVDSAKNILLEKIYKEFFQNDVSLLNLKNF